MPSTPYHLGQSTAMKFEEKKFAVSKLVEAFNAGSLLTNRESQGGF